VEIVDMKKEAEGIVSIYLAGVDGYLPEWEPGAHIDLHLGNEVVRQYSLCNNPTDTDQWRIAVLKEPQSRGGSEFVHTHLRVGDHIRCSLPRNNFPLTDEARYLFIAGGIGITPILPMLEQCEREGRSWKLVYGGRSLSSMAFLDELEAYGEKVLLWPQDENGHINLPELLSDPEEGLAVFSCGPGPLLDAVEGFSEAWPDNTASVHMERFRADPNQLAGEQRAFEIELDSSGEVYDVPADKSIIEVLAEHGIHVPTSCREGTCGTCETGVFEGEPDHRDSYLTKPEKESNEVMMLCCSRSCSKRLVLDL
jgi:ferredoxin-NADP reductase